MPASFVLTRRPGRQWNVTLQPQTMTASSSAPVSGCLAMGLQLFETILNAIYRAAPNAAIAFNTRPDDSADAAARWLSRG